MSLSPTGHAQRPPWAPSHQADPSPHKLPRRWGGGGANTTGQNPHRGPNPSLVPGTEPGPVAVPSRDRGSLRPRAHPGPTYLLPGRGGALSARPGPALPGRRFAAGPGPRRRGGPARLRLRPTQPQRGPPLETGRMERGRSKETPQNGREPRAGQGGKAPGCRQGSPSPPQRLPCPGCGQLTEHTATRGEAEGDLLSWKLLTSC